MGRKRARWVLCICLLAVICGAGFCVDLKPNERQLSIGDLYYDNNGTTPVSPYFMITVDAAGYSDWILYGYSPEHPHPYHELLSGEWGGAVYYTGVDTEPLDPNTPTGPRQAMWLTNWFSYPDWTTNSKFIIPSDPNKQPQAWDNPNNPVAYPSWLIADTGFSYVKDDCLEVRIDYEIADLDTVDPNLCPIRRSPMGFLFKDATIPTYIYSDRYVLLQTYTFRNIDPNNQPMTNLEFYQFLHSHGADEYGPAVNSCYQAITPADALQYYQPRNPVHQAGNFCYDITQWNSEPFIDSDVTHIDYNGFSCTVEPDWFDNDVYEGGHWYSNKGGTYTPPIGTHHHIENRQLNNVPQVYRKQAGGAMGWNLGTLDPNETTSITIAYMFAMEQENHDTLTLTKTDDVDESGCVEPDDEVTYTLNWENVSTQPVTNAVLIDYLPAGVTYPITYTFDPNFTPVSSDPAYNEQDHSYTWDLGTLPASSSGSMQLTVIVNSASEPGLFLRNRAELRTDIGLVKTTLDTPVCCWDEINGTVNIYVNKDATGNNNGVNWENAYTDLQSALNRARNTRCSGLTYNIYVADGVYSPGRNTDDTFALPEGVLVYGGYVGEGPTANDRNPKQYQTILSGYNPEQSNETVVTMGDNTLLDGCVVQEAALFGQGILCKDVDFVEIVNCDVKDNLSYGVYADNANVTLTWCTIRSNRYEGIRHEGNNKSISIQNCCLLNNQRFGIYLENSISEIKNSVICKNGFENTNYFGIRLKNPIDVPVLYNNTVVYNSNEAIAYTDEDPNHVNTPDIQNCIIWYNNMDGSREQFAGWKVYPLYSCVYDPNDPDGTNYTLNAFNNFSGKPDFAYPYPSDPNNSINVHLNWDSFCKDKGNPSHTYTETGQYDMDYEDRINNYRVDVGADEILCDEIYNQYDWNADGIVNLYEFDKFSQAWLSHDPNDPAWLADPNLIDPDSSKGWYEWKYKFNLDTVGGSAYTIDTADLIAFCEDSPQIWLWQACWLSEQWQASQQQSMMSISMPATESSNTLMTESVSIAITKTVTPKKSVEQQVIELEDAAKWLEDLWFNELEMRQSIDEKSWNEFMQSVYESLNDLKTIKENQTLTLSEDLQ